jgi:uncharacterized membrane protein
VIHLSVRAEGRHRNEKGREDRDLALDALRRRYAAGEIFREEYENMRKTIER